MQEIRTESAPGAIGPYSQGIVDGETVYVSGQGPVDPVSGEVVSEEVSEQTARTLDNVAAVLDAVDLGLADVVKATVFVTDMSNYSAVNEVYEERMSDPYPARSAVEVRDLPIDIEVEIEAIATLGSD